MLLYLASQSQRRKQLLEEAGFTFEIIVPDAGSEDERRTGETSAEYVCRLARQKAENVIEKINLSKNCTVIACDTLVLCGDEILGKPADRQDAERMLKTLLGQKHSVLSGLCVMDIKDGKTQTIIEKDETVLVMQNISDAQLTEYLDGGNWQGKAGAFGYQDGNSWLAIISGSESNVVGLPMELLMTVLTKLHQEPQV
ncbi:MAG: Maf family protein [Planctomycetaceae bacterium]|nr:Maf family protein [Planctomycetaceae bacterium]